MRGGRYLRPRTPVARGRARGRRPARRSALSAPEVSRPPLLASPADDAELGARIRAGDERAFEALYLALHERLWRFAYAHVRSRDVAEEIVQEVFLALWRGRAEWEARASARAWLYAAVRNLARNHRRHERVVARLEDHAAGRASPARAAVARPGGGVPAMGASAPDPLESAAAREMEEAVVRAIGALPERRRIAMMLRWRHELAPAEIARVLGTTPEAVRVLLTRARQELAALLGRARR